MLCTLCPRNCNQERDLETGKGFCKMGTQIKIARAALHFFEEPCISGTKGSGAIFFSGCTLHCVYCQNEQISHLGQGKSISVKRLSDIFKTLYDQGAHNINLVTATQFIPQILQAFELYKPPIPVVYNTSGYEKVQTLQLLKGVVDIYLPDFKHVKSTLSALCAHAPDYFEYASKAIQEMVSQTGAPQYDAQGMMTKGTLIRHLVLPNCTTDSMRVLDYIKAHFPSIPLSLMAQYTPLSSCPVTSLNRRVTEQEYARVLQYMLSLGLKGYTQERNAANSAYTPSFDLTGVE